MVSDGGSEGAVKTARWKWLMVVGFGVVEDKWKAHFAGNEELFTNGSRCPGIA